MRRTIHRFARAAVLVAGATLPVAVPARAGAQWSRTYEQFYYAADHNWVFRRYYPAADRLFNAFDYGHAILYETLWAHPDAPVSRLERTEYDFLTRRLLTNPPRVPLEEQAIEPLYSRLAPEAKAMFEWAHILHRQIYDVLADERIADGDRDARVRELLEYYRSRRDLAFSEKPKSMALMQEQPYSLAFRQRYPKFNGLIWAYHWLQVGLYEPLLVGKTVDERQSGVLAAVARFRQMIEQPPSRMPHVMPMTAAIAPTFATRYPEVAIIFDNLHSLHDVISDILANPSVPRDRKRAEILLAARRYRDDTTQVMSVAGWRRMAEHMGIENQGGPAVGFTPAFAAPTVAYGAVMRHDAEGNMLGEHAGHGATPDSARAAAPAPPAPDEHAGHDMGGGRDSADVAAVVAGFHAALARGDSTGALALLAPEATIHESGGMETRAEYRAGHLRADIAFAAAVPRTAGPITVRVRGDAAWASSTSTARGSYRGREVNSTTSELMVLERTPAGWRIAAIHWSSRSAAPR